MSTDIFNKYGIIITKFYGGDERGLCYQVTIEDKYVQLTERELGAMIREIAFGD